MKISMTPGKIIIAAFVLLLIIIGTGLYSINILRTSSGEIKRHIELVETAVKKDEWAKARNLLSTAEQDWNSSKKFWSILLDHIEIDNIDTSLARLKSYLEANDKAMVLGESANLLRYIEHIPDKEAFNLQNIL